jgi:hypothetical protein
MTLQEIIKSLDDLSAEDQAALFGALRLKLSQEIEDKKNDNLARAGETFWEMTLRFRERIEREGIDFTDEDFTGLRDRSSGREVEL